MSPPHYIPTLGHRFGNCYLHFLFSEEHLLVNLLFGSYPTTSEQWDLNPHKHIISTLFSPGLNYVPKNSTDTCDAPLISLPLVEGETLQMKVY